MKPEKKIRERVDYRDIREMVEDIGERWADRYAYSFRINPRDKEVVRKTYPELRDEVRALSMAFIKHGIAGKHITLIGKYSYNWVLTYYASMCTASVLIPLDKDWAAADLTATAQRADTEILIVDKAIAEKGREIAAALELRALRSSEVLRRGVSCEVPGSLPFPV